MSCGLWVERRMYRACIGEKQRFVFALLWPWPPGPRADGGRWQPLLFGIACGGSLVLFLLVDKPLLPLLLPPALPRTRPSKILDELRHLEDFFTSQNRQARQPMVGLYEQAQACTMVLPRLYLLNTVGACYILSKEAPARVSQIGGKWGQLRGR